LVYLLALGAGRLSATMGMPRVTGYLIVGLAAGPSVDLLGLPVLLTLYHRAGGNPNGHARISQSEGSLTDTILPLIGINNLVAIIAFILLRNSALTEIASVLSIII